jgi:integrase
MQLVAIEPRDVKRLAAELAGRGLAPSSVRKAIAPLRALLATAFEEGLIRSNPAAGLRIAQRVENVSGEPRAKALAENELRALLAEFPDEWRLFFEFLAHTGLRIGEAVALTWADLDFGKRRERAQKAVPWPLRLTEVALRPPNSSALAWALTGPLAASRDTGRRRARLRFAHGRLSRTLESGFARVPSPRVGQRRGNRPRAVACEGLKTLLLLCGFLRLLRSVRARNFAGRSGSREVVQAPLRR